MAGTDVGSYAGIDISRPALDLAAVELAVLRCPVTLIEQDFAGALADWKDLVDVVWIGQSLHHLSRDGKQAVARDVRRILAPGGQFLIWEPTSLPGEDRSGWADRVAERGSAFWPEFDDEERETVVAHCRASDYPETADWWLSLRQAGGFSDARDLLEAPPGLGRVYAFTA